MGIRCFIAISLNESVRREIAMAVERLRGSGADVKWVPADNLHITVKFLGSVDEELIPTAKEKLSRIAASHMPFTFALYGTGLFPDKRRPRVVWIDIRDSDALGKLQEDVEKELVTIGFEREDRSFSPHLTIGRIRSPKNIGSLLVEMEPLKDRDFGNIEVDSFSLMKSELNPKGAKYTEISGFTLGRQ